jgi:SAM-dependent methyltransferase
MKKKKEWFEDWFDTSFYHILYQDRDYKEAEKFISKLSEFLNLPKDSYILDLACGKGRHALQLNGLGYRVKGVDLSENSISEASKDSNQSLSFEVGDMRIPLSDKFDAVYNLFTSFGYFNCSDENLKVLNAISQMLNSKGIFVIDFMNAKKIIAELVEKEVIEKSGIKFSIRKQLLNNQIIKSISFNTDGKDYAYQEQVQALFFSDFQNLLQQTDLVVDHVFGNYMLEDFNEITSDRLILIGHKS